MTSCTPENVRTVTKRDAQPIGVSGRRIFSASAIRPRTIPKTVQVNPVTVLRRRGSTEKLTNMLSQRLKSFLNV
jgi:hypothetical protein